MPPKKQQAMAKMKKHDDSDGSDESPVKTTATSTTTTTTTTTTVAQRSKTTAKPAASTQGEDRTYTQLEMNLIVQLLSAVGSQAIDGGIVIKVSWLDLARRTGIATSGAAAKRAERVLKRFGLKMSEITGSKGGRTFPDKTAAVPAAPAPAPAPTTKATTKAPAGQKRKREERVEEEDDDDEESPERAPTRAKTENRAEPARKSLPAYRPNVKNETLADVLYHASEMLKEEEGESSEEL